MNKTIVKLTLIQLALTIVLVLLALLAAPAALRILGAAGAEVQRGYEAARDGGQSR